LHQVIIAKSPSLTEEKVFLSQI